MVPVGEDSTHEYASDCVPPEGVLRNPLPYNYVAPLALSRDRVMLLNNEPSENRLSILDGTADFKVFHGRYVIAYRPLKQDR